MNQPPRVSDRMIVTRKSYAARMTSASERLTHRVTSAEVVA